MPAQRILFQHYLHMGIEPIETLPHIDGRECQKNACRRRETQHSRPRSNRSRVCTGSGSRQRTFMPDGLSTSMAHFSFVPGAGRTLTSLNAIAAGVLVRCCVLLSHQLRVARGTPYCREKALRVRPLRRNCSTIRSRSALGLGCNGLGHLSMPAAYSTCHAGYRCTPLTAYRGSVVTISAGVYAFSIDSRRRPLG